MHDKLKELITSLANDMREPVDKIEAGIKTTQNNYGQYMSLISTLSKGEKRVALIIAQALIEAGANVAGVNSAMKVLFG